MAEISCPSKVQTTWHVFSHVNNFKIKIHIGVWFDWFDWFEANNVSGYNFRAQKLTIKQKWQ